MTHRGGGAHRTNVTTGKNLAYMVPYDNKAV